MMRATPREVARRWFEETWNQRKSDLIPQLMAPEAPGHTEGAELAGPEQFREMQQGLLGAFPDLKLTVEDVIEDGDQAVVRWRFSGTHSGPGLGMEPTNRCIEARGMTWLIIREGRIVEGWDCWNQGAFLAALQ